MRRMLCLLLIPSVLQAQQISFDIGATSDCLAAGGGMDCVGRAASACMEASAGGYSTVGMGACTDLELDWWDGRLNAVYQDTRARLADMDAQSAGFAPNQVQALKDMQRAWIPFRDARCAFEATEWQGGSGAGPAALWCLMEETARQSFYLDDRGRN